MLQARVITWREDRGFGFLQGRDPHRDIFVHRRDVKFEHRYKMSEGLTVSYRLEEGEKGPIAKDVKILLLSWPGLRRTMVQARGAPLEGGGSGIVRNLHAVMYSISS